MNKAISEVVKKALVLIVVIFHQIPAGRLPRAMQAFRHIFRWLLSAQPCCMPGGLHGDGWYVLGPEEFTGSLMRVIPLDIPGGGRAM